MLAMLYRIYVLGDDRSSAAEALRHLPPAKLADWGVPPLPDHSVAQFAVTIVDLAEFAADTYPTLFDEWCRATLAALGVEQFQDPRSDAPIGPQ